MPLKIGSVLQGRYRIAGLLAQGGFGAVYRAWDMVLNRPCAVKENLDVSPEAERQFKREAQILANLSHPNLPHINDHFILPNQGQYLVMDFVDGEDLQAMLDRTGAPLPEAQAIDWILQVCDALNYMHCQKPPVIHRDIKPANIKITPDGRAILVDFGIAKLYNPALLTTEGARAVTPGYSPPEQYGRGATDSRSDVYALGATLYKLLTNVELPESVKIISGNAPPPGPVSTTNPSVRSAVGNTIARAMNIDRSTRYANAGEFQRAMNNAITAPPPTLVTPTPAPRTAQAAQVHAPPRIQQPPAKRNPLIFGFLAVFLGVICLASGVFLANYLNLPQSLYPPTQTPTPTATSTTQPSFTPTSTPTITPSTTPSTTPTMTVAPTATWTDTPIPQPQPRITNFFACLTECKPDGNNATRVFPGGIEKIYLHWEFADIPVGSHYIRRWEMEGQEWVRYDCTWPGPMTGSSDLSIREPDGLHSGTWDIFIILDGEEVMHEQLFIEGNWTYWHPAGVFHTCFGYR